MLKLSTQIMTRRKFLKQRDGNRNVKYHRAIKKKIVNATIDLLLIY